MSVHSLGLLGSLVACAFAQSLNTQKKIAYDGVLSDISSGCPISGPASCHNSTVEENLCCFESPGGLLLQVQFWDTNPPTGPADHWTIHGLWPDHCDGSYSENCDPSRDYTNISQLLTSQGANDTLRFMEKFWLNDPNDGSNEEFWEHEWATHGTCYSTLQPKCLPSGSPKGAEAVAFFETVVGLFKDLPTYRWLEHHRITPSKSKNYTLAAVTDALKTSSGGVKPALSCTNGTLSSISWYFNLKGSLIDGEFDAIDAPYNGSCPSSFSYLPKYPETE